MKPWPARAALALDQRASRAGGWSVLLVRAACCVGLFVAGWMADSFAALGVMLLAVTATAILAWTS